MSRPYHPLGGIFSALLGGAPLEPMTNAGRYLGQLDRGDGRFACTGEEISEELLAGLRRIQITSAKEASA